MEPISHKRYEKYKKEIFICRNKYSTYETHKQQIDELPLNIWKERMCLIVQFDFCVDYNSCEECPYNY